MSKFSRNSKFLAGGNHFENFGFSFYSSIMAWCFKTKSRSALQQKSVDWSRRVLAIGGIFFYPRSIFDLVIAGQTSIFGHFSGKSFFTFQSQYWQNYESDMGFSQRLLSTLFYKATCILKHFDRYCRCISHGKP